MDLFIKFLVAAVGAGTPLLFGTVGEILNEKVGHLNLGVEGMMAIGACAGFMAGYLTDNFALALLAAFGAGVLSALVYAVLTVTFLANQNVAGLTMTIFGVGLSNFIGVYMLDKSGATTLKLPENVTAQMRSVTIPVLSDLPVVGELLFSYNPFVYIGILVAAVCGFYLYRTKKGVEKRRIWGYAQPTKFYHPSYRGIDMPTSKDVRRTLYWNPEVKTDAEGKASAVFFTNCRDEVQIRISARGITPDGRMVDAEK